MLPINPIIWWVIAAVVAFLLKKTFSNKKTLLTGPMASGKTTFLQYISKEKIPDGASGAPRKYKIKDATFDEVTDFSGAEAWLRTKFDEYIKTHDYILFFFDITEYLKDEEYRKDVNARIDMINNHIISSQITLLVGTHIDTAPSDYKNKVENMFAGKTYHKLLNKMVYVNTTKKDCVKTILNELNRK